MNFFIKFVKQNPLETLSASIMATLELINDIIAFPYKHRFIGQHEAQIHTPLIFNPMFGDIFEVSSLFLILKYIYFGLMKFFSW